MNVRGPAVVLSFLAVAALQPLVLQAADATHTVISANDVKWGPAPPSLPAGAQAARLLGDPGAEGPFVLRLKFPAGYVVPPHTHPKAETVTVISGKMKIGHGDKVEKEHALPAGSFFHMPAEMVHYAWAEGETVLQLNGNGPFTVTYVNPKDDPRKK